VGCEDGLEDCWIKVALCEFQRKDCHYRCLLLVVQTWKLVGHILDVRLFKKSLCSLYIFMRLC